MHEPSSSGGAGADADEDEFDVVIPQDLLIFDGLIDDADEYADHQAPMEQQPQHYSEEAQAQGGEEQLSMSYHGQMYVFNSVQPQKVETIFSVLNGQEMAPAQSSKPRHTYLVQPIVVPEDFDRPAALMRYRAKRKNLKFIVKADYSCRREVASRMKRARGKFVATPKNQVESQAKTTKLSHCTNCGESSELTPMMRRAPDGSRSFCNACGLMWAKTRKLRQTTDQPSGSQGGRPWIRSRGI